MNVLKAMSFFTIILLVSTFISTYIGGSQVYPKTTAEIQKCLSSFVNQINSQVASNTNQNSYQIIVDTVSLLISGMVSIFTVFLDLANIIRLYMIETFGLLGVNMADNIMFSAFMTIIGLMVQVFIVLSVIEWIRPGYTKE